MLAPVCNFFKNVSLFYDSVFMVQVDELSVYFIVNCWFDMLQVSLKSFWRCGGV